ncbi:DUF1285 domain-containing protein [Haematospirillum jordaniae]|uniref:Proteophosphoglycan n=1 Tax=Haematospirillum jordaniae TaxID=1549855 RepID=A0A143DF08_9PROT|nr:MULTISPECIES: DUF1285 domain-containing protein [Haematospirillum]AMW34708.1 hypothetical protein AY555_05405 [Haematospirillum jordaniae]NKD44750.1 DUF1285 domain-containing protein [Haematospirillum jordaniae]NKD55230.1 DUF1285 domain-containing protein [Haematospirillum sp. H4890]NKD56939.1 DUF1285 domain-containing protein [Haematospirillum jordaniae]NKD58905.1 DUF1285 domain-containing protein [Haematospirillum jordaniae]
MGHHDHDAEPADAVLRSLVPDSCGDLGLSIDRNGDWFYLGSPIRRPELVRLFASVLSRDASGTYWLVTPAERGTVSVADVPFVAVDMTVAHPGPDQVISLHTNVDDVVVLDDAHPLRMARDRATGCPLPYIYIRKGLEARLSRPVYYRMVDLALCVTVAASSQKAAPGGAGPDTVGVWSCGSFFPLGQTGP